MNEVPTASQNSLGIYRAQTKMNMGPIKRVARINFNFQRVFVNLIHEHRRLLGAQSLCDVAHVS